jgi:hypothetical protein
MNIVGARFQLFRQLLACLSLSIVPFWCHASATSADSLTLISITGIQLSKNEFLEGIALTTRNLRILAVCHVPAGWSVSVSNPTGPIGGVEAGASGGVAELGAGDLRELHAFLLARPSKLATVDIGGTADIEMRGDQPEAVTRQLGPLNFALAVADRCPGPEAWK